MFVYFHARSQRYNNFATCCEQEKNLKELNIKFGTLKYFQNKKYNQYSAKHSLLEDFSDVTLSNINCIKLV